MKRIREEVLETLKEAQETGEKWVMFIHGWSGSRQTTSRSQIRGLMRSAGATPYIVRSECIQHDSVFIAAIRQKT
jgi:hypothetical protein